MLMLVASLAAVSSVASGYAHWVFFAGRTAPFNGVPATFTLGSLTNNTVSYFISDQGPTPLNPGDSVANVVSQIQAAAAVWNTVPSSNIRVAFGGFAAIGAPQTALQATPGIDVVFNDDVLPGLVAQTSLTLPADLSPVANGASSVPILRSTITLRRNMTSPNPMGSYDDVFFTTVVHEFGHALGLQHTLTSGAMSTIYTSATTKAAPLSPDDIAGISLLYPAQGYAQGTGTVSGSVLVAGQGVNMANVVALSANGTAISTLTNPDGTFQIQGVPPGAYYVYASPLPPPQQGETYGPDNIAPPEDAQGRPFAANTGFDTEFLGGTRDWTKAGTVTVSAGTTSGGVNFNLQTRPGPPIAYVETVGYFGANQIPVASPPLLNPQYLVFGCPNCSGLTTSSGLVAGLGVTAIGAATVDPTTLTYNSPGLAEIAVYPGQVQAGTPVALVVTFPNDMYVLPYAFSVVPNAPPSITGVSGATDGLGNTTVNLKGANLNATTSVVFDGAPAPILSVNRDGSLTVAAPPAAAGYTTYIEALSTDGQTSWQDLGNGPRPTYTYPAPQNPSIAVNYGPLLPGATAMLDISGVNTLFANGQVSIGLASSDITVGQVWVLNTLRVLANVTVSPRAQPGPVDLTVTSGLETLTLPAALQVQVANPNQMTLQAPVLDQVTGLAGTPAGGLAVISSTGVPLNLTGWTALLDYNYPTTAQMENGNLIYVPIPSNVPPGPAIVQLTPPGGNALLPAVVMQIDLPDPVIAAAVNVTGNSIGQANPVHIGDTMTLYVTGLTQSVTGAGLSNAQVTVGGVSGSAVVTPLTVNPGSAPDSYQIQFTLGPNVPFGPSQWVTVGIGTRVSAEVPLFILPHP